MRLKRNRLKECSHRRAMTVKDSEGVAAVTYGSSGTFSGGSLAGRRKAAGRALRHTPAEHPKPSSGGTLLRKSRRK